MAVTWRALRIMGRVPYLLRRKLAPTAQEVALPNVAGFVDFGANIDPRLVFVGAGARIWRDDTALDGEICIAVAEDGLAVAFSITFPNHDVERDAGQGRLTAWADIDQTDGITTVVAVRLRRVLDGGGTAWIVGTPTEILSESQAAWHGETVKALAGIGARPKLPPNARPHGKGVCHLELRGEITPAVGLSLEREIERAEGQTVHLTINSTGGNLFASMELYQALAGHRHRVEADIVQAMSGAAIAAMGCDVRRIDQHGTILLHEPSFTSASGDARKLRALAADLDRFATDTAAIFAKGTGRGMATVQAWLSPERVFTAAQALKAGLVHQVTNEAAPARPAAVRARFRNYQAPFTARRVVR